MVMKVTLNCLRMPVWSLHKQLLMWAELIQTDLMGVYRRGSYYRNVLWWISSCKIKINVFFPDILCIVNLVAGNGEVVIQQILCWTFTWVYIRKTRVESSVLDQSSAKSIFTNKFPSHWFQTMYQASWKPEVPSHTILFEIHPKLEALNLK